MKILHSPIEIAGQMGILSRSLCKRGIESAAYNTFHSYLGYKDYVLNMDVYELEWMMLDVIRYFDLFHFHYGSSLLPDFEDLEIIHREGKSMVMHHWGNDVRTHALATANNRYAYTGDSPPEEQIHTSLLSISRYIRHAIVQDYEVYPYVKAYYQKVHVLPITMDVMQEEPSYPDINQSNPLVLHAPTNPLFKGTEAIETAIERLQKEGIQFRYQRIEKMSHGTAKQLYKNADIVVDQILCGSYGMLAVESMSLGKPVVGYIRDDLIPLFPMRPPIVSANPDNIYDVLKELILYPAMRVKKGKEGRKYAEKYHDSRHVVEHLIRIYKEIDKEG